MVGCLTGCPASPEQRQPNLLVITVDTLRADHVSCYGHALATTPTVDRLAAQGVRFEDAAVQWPKTWPSMASMLTGTYPTANGIRYLPRRQLPDGNVTLAELLRDAGYRTAAVVSNVNLGKKFAFDQGFDTFIESWVEELLRVTGRTALTNEPGKVKRYTNATIVTNQAIRLVSFVPITGRRSRNDRYGY